MRCKSCVGNSLAVDARGAEAAGLAVRPAADAGRDADGTCWRISRVGGIGNEGLCNLEPLYRTKT